MTDAPIILDADADGAQPRCGPDPACVREMDPQQSLDVAGTPHWDRPLDQEAWNKLSWQHKRERLGASLDRKLAIIEAAAHGPSLDGTAGLRLNRTRLREWEDLGSRLWIWSDRRAERADGPHAAAFARFDMAAATLKERIRAAPKGAVTLEDKLAARDQEIKVLRRQVAGLINQLRKCQPSPAQRWR